jgi:transcriptional regulator with XRE-family HTH domain
MRVSVRRVMALAVEVVVRLRCVRVRALVTVARCQRLRRHVDQRYRQVVERRLPMHPLWDRSDMREVLAKQDIAGLFRLLQRMGVSQRRIAAWTGQSQSEISEILGGRRVVAYEVLVRIADGLGIRRGRLGLAYDEDIATLVDEPPVQKNRKIRPKQDPPWWSYETHTGDA